MFSRSRVLLHLDQSKERISSLVTIQLVMGAFTFLISYTYICMYVCNQRPHGPCTSQHRHYHLQQQEVRAINECELHHHPQYCSLITYGDSCAVHQLRNLRRMRHALTKQNWSPTCSFSPCDQTRIDRLIDWLVDEGRERGRPWVAASQQNLSQVSDSQLPHRRRSVLIV